MLADVVIVGGGPNGLQLAAELGLAGVPAIVLETLPAPSPEPKANGLLGQVVRLMERRGLYEQLAGEPGPPRPNSAYFMFAAMPLDLSRLDDSPVYNVAVPQLRIVEVLERRAWDVGAEVRRGHEVAGVRQDDGAVTVDVDGPEGRYQLRTRYLVGADGGHSVVRKATGIDFAGVTLDRTTSRHAHATLPAHWIDPRTGELHVPGYGAVRPFLPTRTDHGAFSFAPFPGRAPLIATTEWDQPPVDVPMSLDEMRESIGRVLGVDVPIGAPAAEAHPVLRRLVGLNVRLAERFRDRRIFLIGDAAHVGTAGGSGLNLGLHDAVNLGWKLAAAVAGTAPPGLLDTYESERRPAAQRMVMYGQAQAVLTQPGRDVTALRELFGELLGQPDVIAHLAALTAGSDVVYDMGGGSHPLVGRFAPDLDPAGVLRTGRPVLVDSTVDGVAIKVLPTVDVVRTPVAGATAMLIRPDSYVAWATSSAEPDQSELDGLLAAWRRWFG
jgi:2-polyprenyl-6-methoxyphenol hydroxylase-like FAD-dependent oxidoreductase